MTDLLEEDMELLDRYEAYKSLLLRHNLWMGCHFTPEEIERLSKLINEDEKWKV